MNSITVYCSSSDYLDPQFHDEAATLGAALAQRDITLIYGGGRVGLMGEIARSAKAAGGKVVGIITTKLKELERGYDGCDELIVIDTMRERKHLLAQRGDGFIILPGGVGTYEEFFEILVGRLVGEHAKPIGIVNAHGYYNPMISMIEHGIEHRFIREGVKELLEMEPDPITLLEKLLAHEPTPIDPATMLPMGEQALTAKVSPDDDGTADERG